MAADADPGPRDRHQWAMWLTDRRLYALRDTGLIEQRGRGLFQLAKTAGGFDPDLALAG